jgi:hypothetical protein
MASKSRRPLGEVFVRQLLFDGGQNSKRFPLLSLAHVPRTSAAVCRCGTGAGAAGSIVRGDSATLKAVNITAVIMITNIAASLWGLHGRDRVLAGHRK